MRAKYSPEFKLSIARQIVSGEKRCGEICRMHGLSSGMISRWSQEYRERGKTAWGTTSFSPKSGSIQERLTKLEQTNEKIRAVFRAIN